jgi:hypothetical protein
MFEMLNRLTTLQQQGTDLEEVLTFEEYLALVLKQPWITRNTSQQLHDMILSGGVEHSIQPGKPVKHRYQFFELKERVGNYVVFGQQ